MKTVADSVETIRLAEVLTRLMQQAKVSSAELGRNTNLAPTTINRLCSGESNPTINSLAPIAKFFNVSIVQLLGLAPLFDNDVSNVRQSVNTWILVPIIELAEALNWPENIELIKQRKNLSHIPVDAMEQENLFALKLQGNSLEPRFSPGTVLVFSPDMSIRDGAIALIAYENKQLPQFKELLLDGSDIYVRSVNPLLPGSKIENLDPTATKILGVLMHARMDYAENE